MLVALHAQPNSDKCGVIMNNQIDNIFAAPTLTVTVQCGGGGGAGKYPGCVNKD